ncbi:MAG TPA: hypothetical protein VI072_31295 [Polyangiaceae bacterium]
MLRLHVTRSAITIQAPEGPGETTRASVALGTEGFRAGILGVGEDETALARRLCDAAASGSQHRWLARKILNAVEKRVGDSTPRSEPSVHFVRPGEDPYWDAKWRDFKTLEQVDLGRPDNPRQVLVVNPLGADTWSPHLTRGMLMYVLWTGILTGHKVWPPFRRPKLELHVAGDFSDLEYAELVDQLRSLWGQNRVQLPPGREVAPRPLTAYSAGYVASRVVVFAAFALAFFSSMRAGGNTLALVAVGVAGAALLIGRKLKGRSIYELPRRGTARRPEPVAESK